MLHFDVMDGEFVPNFAISPPFIAAVRQITQIPFDVHIMVTHPAPLYRRTCRKRLPISLLFTSKVQINRRPVISAIKSHGLKSGLALRPKTAISAVMPYLSDLDLVLPMSVEPGFGGSNLSTQYH